MSLQGLNPLLRDAASFKEVVKSLVSERSTMPLIAPEAAWGFVLAAVAEEAGLPILIVTPRPEDAHRLHDQLRLYRSDAQPTPLHFAEHESLPFERLITDAGTVHQRLYALAGLIGHQENKTPPMLISSIAALAQKTIPKERFAESCHVIQRGQRVELQELVERWLASGYRMETGVEVPGAMSRRDGILDIYPPGSPLPVRLELWGPYVESIRLFDPGTQRSVKMVDSVSIIPAQELLPSTNEDALSVLIGRLDFSICGAEVRDRMMEELASLLAGRPVEDASFYAGFFNSGTLLDFFPREGLIVLCHPGQLDEAGAELDRRVEQLRLAKAARGEIPGNFPWPHLSWQEASRELERCPHRLVLGKWEGDSASHSLGIAQAPTSWGRLDTFADSLRDSVKAHQRVVVVSQHSQRLAEILSEADIGVTTTTSLDSPPAPATVTLVHGSLQEGWSLSLADGALTVLSDAEVFGIAKVRRPVRRQPVRREAFLSEIRPGSYVVHTEHGIARFVGTTKSVLEDGEREYLMLEYAEGDRLYVPMEHLDRVTPYVAGGEHPPALTRLGTQEWERAKERVKRSAREMAKELLSLYAARELAQGFTFSPDSPWQKELEDSFPYVETPDQMKAILDVKEDMEQPRPMDRLVCGDVGYGKTEVALRAAFKAVTDGMQVAVLVPTTVLAQQHYVTFNERLRPFPVSVDVLSRFRAEKEQQKVLAGLKDGTIDICIGTHRLLQKDVAFKNLGLVVVDEEQRFGVAHKERLKQMRKEVDVLTLSATPIPRTLHMSLAGVRDLSLMETPPEERLPIKTYVSEYSDELVREAILREVDRGGQVFFLHNRVHNIGYVADWIRQLLPEARVAVGHGQMPEEDLERVMAEFAAGEADVLVCTTIIESGLDIPNANTLIVDRADTFGLAQLYQLRGRIGRGANRAYAYFLVPKSKRITETAEKRLNTILAATELGAGFRIAMKDLEIRGAGNILGPEQSGQIHAVGFDLYTRLLAEAVEDLRAEAAGTPAGETHAETPAKECKVLLKLPAHIPEDYVSEMPSRLAIYQRLSKARDLAQVKEIEDELRDRFGHAPAPVWNLLYAVRVRVQGQSAGVESIVREGDVIVLKMSEEIGGARLALEKALGPNSHVGHQQIRLRPKAPGQKWGQVLLEALESLAEFRKRLDQQPLTSDTQGVYSAIGRKT